MATRLVLITTMFCYATYTFPFFQNLVTKEAMASLWDSQDGLGIPVIRSIIFSIVSSLLLIGFSLSVAAILRPISIADRKGKWMSLLLLPFILGNVSASFIWKLILLDMTWPFSSLWAEFISMSLIQFWQYGPLYIYLFWINQQLISQNALIYAKVTRLNPLEILRDFLLPKQRNLTLLLYIIGLITFYYEDAKAQFIFHASRGTGTELVNQWLYRIYQSDNLLSPDFAFQHTSQLSLVVLICGLVGLLISLILFDSLYSTVTTNRLRLPTWSIYRNTYLFIYYVVLVFTLLPVYAIFALQPIHFNQVIGTLAFPLMLTAIAALLATGVAVIFSVINRLALQDMLSTFNKRSMLFLIILFMMTLIPPIVTLILGFKWMQIVGYASNNRIFLAWIAGHIFLAFPLLSGFLITAHFTLKNQHITYLRVHRTSFGEQLKLLFLYPFAADYLLTFILAFSLIWNESTVNNILADVVPCFVAELNKTIMGKEVDYGNGMNYLMVSLILAVTCIIMWNTIISRSQQNKTYDLAEIQ